jgi:PAS domain S-box-containing protein
MRLTDDQRNRYENPFHRRPGAMQVHFPTATSEGLSAGGLLVELPALLTGLPVPAVIHDLDQPSAIRFVNPAFVQSFGYTLTDIPTAAAWAERAYPDPVYREAVRADWRAAIETIRSTGQLVPPAEHRIVDKAGRARHVMMGFAVQGDLVIVTVQDVSEARAAEEALAAERRRAESSALSLTENIPGGVYTFVLPVDEPQARFSFVSQKFLDLLGLTRDEVIAGAAVRLLHPEDRGHWKASIEQAVALRAPSSVEGRFRVRGQTRWIRAESVPRQLPDGSTVWEGIAVDITQLKETEQKLQSVIEASRASVWNLDLLTGQIQFSAGWAAIHGYGSDETAWTFGDWITHLHPDDRDNLIIPFERLKTGQSESERAVYRRRHRDGHWLWLQVHGGVSTRSADGNPVTLSGVTFDITQEMTERIRAQDMLAGLREDLQRAQQHETVSQVAATVAHGVNNVIAVVSGTLEVLEVRSDRQPWLLDGLDRIRRSVDMARGLIGDLRRLSRPEQPRAVQDLRRMMRYAVDLLGHGRIARHGVRMDLPPEEVPVWANPTEITQVIQNLAQNACEAGGETRDATVTVTACPPGTPPPTRDPDAGDVLAPDVPVSVFTVSDTGLGVPDAIRARLFRPNLTTSGPGLGLSIVSAILQGNRAALWLDSVPGKGTTVTVAWPIDPCPQTESPASAYDSAGLADASPVSLEGMHVLVVDDLPDVAEVLVDMLESAGAIAFAISDPQEAQELLCEAPGLWSVLLTDLHMPRIDGRALARFASRLEPPVPVVLLTARPEALGPGPAPEFAAVLSKPISGERLAWVVRDAAGVAGRPNRAERATRGRH